MERKEKSGRKGPQAVIATKEGRLQQEFNKKLFREPWCPLFGGLPEFDIEPPPNSQLGRCLDIIERARGIWGIDRLGRLTFIEDDDGLSIGIYPDSSWPKPAEVSEYPKEWLESARTIFRGRHSAYQHVILPDSTIKNRWQELISFIRHEGVYGKVGDEIPDFAILALLALGFAWDSLRSRHDGHASEHSEINASDLISLAEKQEELAERTEKQGRGQKAAVKAKEEKKARWHNECDKLLKKHFKSHPNWSALRFAIKIKEMLPDPKPSVSRIRRQISPLLKSLRITQ